MGLFEFIDKRIEDKTNEVIKNLQEKRDNFLKKVPLLNYEQHLQEEAELQAKREAKRKAREEAERKAKEEAERKAREEAERKVREAKEAAERKAREEAERKAREEAKREAERIAREEAERKAKEEAERKAREEAERKAKEEKILGEFIPKAESGDAQAACQLGMWFQHGENGITKNIEKAIYWYQKAAMQGNQAALTFLNMALEEKKSNEKNEAQENTLRALYDSNDEYLANEKNDAQAAYRCGVEFGKKASRQYDLKNLERAIELYEKSIQYREKALLFGHPDADTLREDIKTCEKNIKYAQLIIDTEKLSLSDVIADMRENDRRQEEKRRESMVEVRFSADFYYTDYAGRHDRSNSWNCELTKDEYNALLSGGTSSIANYIRSNLLDIRVFPKDSVITSATMAKC